MTKELTQFKYQQLDESTADFLRTKETNMREIVGKAYTELGRELTEARDRLAGSNQYDGVYDKWLMSIGMNKMQANRLTRRYELVTNCDDQTQNLLEDLPVSLTYDIAKPSAESTPAKAQAKTEVLAGDIDTLKEYRERIKELESRAEKAKQQAEAERKERERLEIENEELANREPEIVTEYVERETSEFRDRSLDTPYGVKLLDDFYNAMDELSEWQKKYAWITSDNKQLKSFISVDEDMKEEFRKNLNMWQKISEIFNEDEGDYIEAEIIEIN